jgi:SAM-dependent methyltransferase
MRDSSTRPAAGCPFCGGHRLVRLPDPASQSMTSDWRLVDTPLGMTSCPDCGVAFRDPTLPPPADFSTDYGLYAHPPGRTAEHTRQAAYAAWIAAAVDRPARALDVGCGNGSLLLALRAHWPDTELLGCDPSPDSVHFAQAAGLSAWAGTAADLQEDRRADLVISVNVIEHTADPWMFARALVQAVRENGRIVLVCPDGARPGVELLIADHLYSLTAAQLEAALSAAGFTVTHWSAAPRELGPFQMVVASRSASRATLPVTAPAALVAARESYLRAWQQLDASLCARLPSRVVCFGAGEAAALLRAYAPTSWSRVDLCATDADAGGRFGDRPHVRLDDVSRDEAVLLGVRPQDQERVASRLRTTFQTVITWYDLVAFDEPR